MTKETKNGSVNFHAQVKTYLPPTIVDQFCDDAGELQYCLSNGNTIPAIRYNSLWHPKPGVIDWKAKGNRIDAAQRKY